MDVYSRTNDDSTTATFSQARLTSVPPKETVWKQYLAAFFASLISLSTGCVGGWSATATPKFLNGTSELGIRPLSVEEVSWVSSLINLGAVFGSIPAGYLSFRFGRRVCLLLLVWPIIIGWLFILFNQNNFSRHRFGFCTSADIGGFSYGSMNIALPIYNNEIGNDSIRGRIGTMYDLLQTIGLLYVYFCGAMMSIFWTSVVSLLVPLVFLCTFYWMPESPLYCVRHEQKDEAVKVIKWLYGEDCDVREKLKRIRLALLEGEETYYVDGNTTTSSSSFVAVLKNFYRSLRYTLILILETKNKSREEIQRELGATIWYDDL